MSKAGKRTFRFFKGKGGKVESEEVKEDENEVKFGGFDFSQVRIDPQFFAEQVLGNQFRQFQQAAQGQTVRFYTQQSPLLDAELTHLRQENEVLRRETRALHIRNLNLSLENSQLQQRIDQLKNLNYAGLYSQQRTPSQEISRDLLKLITKYHPDRNRDLLDPTEVVKDLNELRSRYSKK